MNKHLLKLSRLYAISEDKIELVYNTAKEYNIALYDALTVVNKYNRNVKDIALYAKEYTFENKIINWYKGNKYLINTDKFREASINFKLTGAYTNIPVNRHPKSQYAQFWIEEARRCLYGYHIGNDWIPGYYYFYLNYSPIDLAVAIDDTAGADSIRGDRETDFVSMWDGDYYYFHYLEECERTGKQASVLKARGRGYSWKHASMLVRNFALVPKSKSVVYASKKEYLTGNDGILTKAWAILSHIDLNTAWAKRRQVKNTENHKRASLEITKNNIKTETGFMSEISGVTLGDNVHKLRGKRSKLILFEEGGSFKNLITAWIVSDPSVRQDNISFGLKIAFGTGGEEGSEFDGLKDLFYKPEVYNVLPLPNVWSDNAAHNKVGWFAPAYVNLGGYYDDDGNSDMEKGKDYIKTQREQAISKGISPSSLQRTKAENPLIPEDAILRSTLSPFPVKMLTDHLTLLETDSAYRGKHSVGSLHFTSDDSVIWKEDLTNSVHIIGTDDITTRNAAGGIEIYAHPPNNKPPLHTFIIGVDPIDFDKNEVGRNFSLGSAFVINTLTEQIVAEYTGRPDKVDDFYENVRRLAIYYNAKVMYENNLKGLYSYFTNKFSERWLALKPSILQDSNTLMSMGNRKYGFTASGNQNSSVLKYGRQLIKEWLEKYINKTEEEGDTDMRMLHTIRSVGLVKELIDWHADGNFDRVSSMIAVMIYLQDTDRTRQYNKNRRVDTERDKFFSRAFRRHNS